MTEPLVSICIPTFNGEQFIAEAMDSAISQTYPSLEIVVSDDASSDRTLEIIESYKGKTGIPIRIFHHTPRGIGANWNYCIEKARGPYIKFLFQDDILMPKCVERLVTVLESQPNMGMAACKRVLLVEPSYLSEETRLWMERFGDLQRNLRLKSKNGIDYLDKDLFRSDSFFDSPRNKIGEPTTVLFRKDLVKQVGYFNEKLDQILDYEFYYRILKKSPVAILPDSLAKFRLHKRQATSVNRGRDGQDYRAYDKIMYKRYFWLMNTDKRVFFLKKYNPLARFIFRVFNKIKSLV